MKSSDSTNAIINSKNNCRKVHLNRLANKLDEKMLHSSLFLFCVTILTLLLFLNLKFFNANETFYNNIEPIFQNHSILIDDIEKDSPIYNRTYFKLSECNSNIIDLYDGNLKIAHDLIDSNQFTFIYM